MQTIPELQLPNFSPDFSHLFHEHFHIISISLHPIVDLPIGYGPSGFPGGTSGKEPSCQFRRHRDMDSIPGWGRSPGGEHGNPLQYSCLENPMDRGAWQAMVHRVTKTQTRLSMLTHWELGASLQACPHIWFLSGWWPSTPPKGWPSSPFCTGCSMSSFPWWIFAMMRFFFPLGYFSGPILSPAPSNSRLKCAAITFSFVDLLSLPQPDANPLCAGQQGACTQTGIACLLWKNELKEA